VRAVTRVLHVSVVHRPDDPRIAERECRTLAEAGYEVTFLVPRPPDGAGREGGGGAAAGVACEFLPPRPRRRRFLQAPAILAAVRRLRPAVVHVHDPELLTLFPALRPLVPRLVYDMHEYVPEAVAGRHYVPAPLRPAAAAATAVAQRALAALGDGVVTVTAEQLGALGRRPARRVVLPNHPRLERFAAARPRPDLAADPRQRLVYVGSLARNRGCALMLDVMERLAPDEAVLYLGGVFASPDMEREARERLAAGLGDRVRLLGRVAPGDLPGVLAAAEVVWVPALPTEQYRHPTVPTKLLEGLAVGLAALVSDLPGRGPLVREHGCGLAVPATVEGHLAGVRGLLARRGELAAMGARGREAVAGRYSWETVAPRLVDFYRSLLAGPA